MTALPCTSWNSSSIAECTKPSPSGLPRVSLPLPPSSVVVLPEPEGTRQQKHRHAYCGKGSLCEQWAVWPLAAEAGSMLERRAAWRTCGLALPALVAMHVMLPWQAHQAECWTVQCDLAVSHTTARLGAASHPQGQSILSHGALALSM